MADGNSYVTFEHLNVGLEVNFYSRVFYIVSCDPFTRNFLTNSGIEVPADLPYPDDPIDDYRATIAKKVCTLSLSGRPSGRGAQSAQQAVMLVRCWEGVSVGVPAYTATQCKRRAASQPWTIWRHHHPHCD